MKTRIAWLMYVCAWGGRFDPNSVLNGFGIEVHHKEENYFLPMGTIQSQIILCISAA